MSRAHVISPFAPVTRPASRDDRRSRRRGQRSIVCLVGLLLATSACPAAQNTDPVNAAPRPTADEPATTSTTEDAKDDAEIAHRVVFADRTSQGYVLLLTPERADAGAAAPSRDELVTLVEREFAGKLLDEEVRLLIELVRKEPSAAPQPVQLSFDPDDPDSMEIAMRTATARSDLLGLHLESGKTDEFVPSLALEDPILLRALSPEQRATLGQRSTAILVRADYRSQHAFRGLRLLQTLVRLMATEQGALIHDPDTLETMDVEEFTRRRLQSTLANVADQIAVVPFPDSRHGEGFVRLTTRGMRRFGSVDVELDGLPFDPLVLQRGTDLLVGVALVLAREAEVDATGLAIELDDVIDVHYVDAVQGYAGLEGKPPRCADCPEQVLVHLVERPREPTDPQAHVVARVVAPRTISDAPTYDHRVWVAKAITDVFGPLGSDASTANEPTPN
jgi:hypothetical protein